VDEDKSSDNPLNQHAGQRRAILNAPIFTNKSGSSKKKAAQEAAPFHSVD
jgi:hypothetical protein